MQASHPLFRSGAVLCVAVIGLTVLSYGFPYGVDPQDAPLALYIGVALVASGVWAVLPFQIRQGRRAPPALWAIIGFGLFMRGAIFFSIPVLEDDSYRYLWDGAVTANGIDPYQYAPAEFAPNTLFDAGESETHEPDFQRLQSLANGNVETHSRINFPFVSTIYPPLAQAAFAIAHWIEPFGLTGWRVVLLLMDLISLALLLKVLSAFQRPAVWISLYWWNPIVLVQGFGAGHMDLVVLPFLLSALLMAKSGRTGLAAISLAGGAAVKIWPVLLFPFLVRPLLKRPVTLAFYAGLFGLSVGILLWPQLVHALAPEAGLNAYASDWRTHAFVFAILEDVVLAPLEAPGQAARLIVTGFMIALIGALALRYGEKTDQLPVLWATVISALIFLSPTGYPWYFIWLAPLLPLVSHVGLIALTALAPLYWLRFQFGDEALVYQWGIVPIAFGIPLALIVLSHLNKRSADAIRHHHSRFE